MHDARCTMHDARCMMHDARCTIGSLEFFHSILVNFENLEILAILQY